jgi:GNAT superfamily N-acetyltransferase
MEMITLSKENIEQEHICCAISDKKNQGGVELKKSWLTKRFEEGLRFKKMDIRGKVFIEYIPAEYAWRPVKADGYMFVHCLWVSGQHQKHGYAKQLLAACEADSKGMNGVCVITSKKPFLTDKKFFLKQGFEISDTAEPYFELMVKKYKKDAPDPKFIDTAKGLKDGDKEGITMYFSDQCPFLNLYVKEMSIAAQELGISVLTKKLETAKDAQSMSTPYGTFNVFYKGEFLTHMPYSRKGFIKLLNEKLG